MTAIITAGPTREHLDPVRFLSNPSTGKMGFAVAEAAVARGMKTILIAGPVVLKTPRGVARIDVISARDMLKTVRDAINANKSDEICFIATAAVADWRPKKMANKKLKKSVMNGTLELVRNPDILKSVKGVRKVGFAAETGEPTAEAARKCREKGAEFIVANDVTEKGSGFGTDTNRVAFVFADGSIKAFPLMTKRQVARCIISQLLLCRTHA